MKKIYILILVLTVLIPLRFAAASDVEVYNYEGRVSVLRNNKAMALDLDFPSQQGDILRVEQESTLDLSLNFLLGLRFFGPAVCTLTNIEASHVYLKMDSGSVMINMKPLPSDATFEIETPTTIVSAKNSKFYLSIVKLADNTSSTIVNVKTGTVSVYVKSSSSAVTILEGQHLEVPESSFIPSSRNATEEEMKPLQRVLSIYIVEPPVSDNS